MTVVIREAVRSVAPPAAHFQMLKAGQDVVIQIAKEPLAKRAHALPATSLCRAAFWSTCPRSITPCVTQNYLRRKSLAASRLVSEPAAPIQAASSSAPPGRRHDDEIRTDIEFLGKTWNEIKERSEQRKAPSLLHRDLNSSSASSAITSATISPAFGLTMRRSTARSSSSSAAFSRSSSTRSSSTPRKRRSSKSSASSTNSTKPCAPSLAQVRRLHCHQPHRSARGHRRQHGKFVARAHAPRRHHRQDQPRSVKEIVRQIRLRDLVHHVVDFIDMEERATARGFVRAAAGARGRQGPSKALSFNEFGLVCITRKRTKQALERVLCQPCPYCTGSGMVKSSHALLRNPG